MYNNRLRFRSTVPYSVPDPDPVDAPLPCAEVIRVIPQHLCDENFDALPEAIILPFESEAEWQAWQDEFMHMMHTNPRVCPSTN